MILGILGFLHFSLADVLDVLVVAILIYVIFRWIRGTSAMNIFVAILFLFIARIVAVALNMKMVSALLGTIIDVGAIALVVIFQPEIRQFLNRLGRSASLKGGELTLVDKLLGKKQEAIDGATADEIARACMDMSEEKTGALIVLPRKDDLVRITSTGDAIDAKLSRRLLMNLFFKNSPLHDGAVVVRGDRVVAARCTLPITERTDIPARYGMRHKAAIGLTEESDSLVIVVSEQTGTISLVEDGKVTPVKNINTLKLKLNGTERKD